MLISIEKFLSISRDDSLVKNEYTLVLIFIIIALLLALILIGASFFLSNQNPESEKLSPYECGFEPFEDTRHVFNVKFIVIAIFFILFDIEIMFLMPWCVSLSKLGLLSYWSMIDFLFELIVGYFYIWYCGSLDWD